MVYEDGDSSLHVDRLSQDNRVKLKSRYQCAIPKRAGCRPHRTVVGKAMIPTIWPAELLGESQEREAGRYIKGVQVPAEWIKLVA